MWYPGLCVSSLGLSFFVKWRRRDGKGPQASHSSNMFTSPACHRLSVSQAKIPFIRKYYWAIYIHVFFVLLFLLLPLGSEANPSHLTSPDFGKVHVQEENRGRAANAQQERGWRPVGGTTAGTARCAQSHSDPRHPAPLEAARSPGAQLSSPPERQGRGQSLDQTDP